MRSFNFINRMAICLAFSLAACHSDKNPKASSPIPAVDVVIVTARPVSNMIEVNGSIVANQYVELHPEVGGRITYLNVHEGQAVTKGTLIARINDQDLEAQLNKSKVTLDLAIKTEERLKKLLDINGVNQADYDAATNLVNTTKADIKYYAALIDKTFMRAPFSGVLGLRNVSLGAFVSTTDLIASLQQMDSLKIDFLVPDQYSTSIHKGDSVSILPDGVAQHKQKAMILAIEPQVNTLTRSIKVRALLGKGAHNIGAFAKVYVDAGTNANAILVPTNAIIPDDKSNKVIVVKGGKAIYTDVKTGIRQANTIEITSGLKEGDSLVVTGVMFTRANGAVKVRGVKKQEEPSPAK